VKLGCLTAHDGPLATATLSYPRSARDDGPKETHLAVPFQHKCCEVPKETRLTVPNAGEDAPQLERAAGDASDARRRMSSARELMSSLR
jgi:hypothetical protein